MSVIQDLVNLTEKKYDEHVQDQIETDGESVNFKSNQNFDWYIEGVFIYDMDLQLESDHTKYVKVGVSNVYESDDPKDGIPNIYIREDYHNILKRYYPGYCASDYDFETPNQKTYTNFVIASCK